METAKISSKLNDGAQRTTTVTLLSDHRGRILEALWSIASFPSTTGFVVPPIRCGPRPLDKEW